tara:strand:- start:1680 stop:1952 length:273 start_codon:yes stop_codon:yes gene_type:complete
MPDKPEVQWVNLDGKGWLYKNEQKANEKHPDFKGKLAGIPFKELEKAVDSEGNVNIHLSGWSEKDKNDVGRVGLKPSMALAKEEEASKPF